MFIQENNEKLSNSEIVKAFRAANFTVGDYELLIYEDPWYTRIFRLFSD